MTDREKIIEIIKKNGTYNGRSLSFDYYVIQPDDLADALIAAGIGDVKETQHRTEVTYRALLNMTKKYCVAERKIATTKDGWFSCGEVQLALLAHEAIRDAEKELAEEKKDE